MVPICKHFSKSRQRVVISRIPFSAIVKVQTLSAMRFLKSQNRKIRKEVKLTKHFSKNSNQIGKLDEFELQTSKKL